MNLNLVMTSPYPAELVQEFYRDIILSLETDAADVANTYGYTYDQFPDQHNAIAHAHSSAQLALSVPTGGDLLATLLGSLKEITSEDARDMARDLYNNEVGRRIAEFIELNNLDAWAADALVINALENGHLIVSLDDPRIASNESPTWLGPTNWPEPFTPLLEPTNEPISDQLRDLFDDLSRFITDPREHLPNWLTDLEDLLRDILSDPIVLDLDGDGIELTPLAQSATMFDLDGDGTLERTGWVSPQDGLLVHDANGNGTVDGVAELFGSANVDGYDELATLDINNDGLIDGNDAAFAELRVWRDLNSDGISTPDELQTLTEAGIASLNLTYNQVDQDDNGNVVARSGTYVRTDGTSRSMASVNFALEEVRPTIPAGADLSGLGLLPNLSGYLGLPDLRTAMFFDPTLKAMVQELVYGDHGFDTFAEFRDGGFLDVLYRWADIDTSVPLAPDDPPYFLQLLSAFLGRPFEELNNHQIERLEEEAWSQLVQQLGVQFLFQAAELPKLVPFVDLLNDLVALDPTSPTYLETIAAMTEAAVNESLIAAPAYDYLELFTGLMFDPSTGEITGDFDAFVAAFIEDEPSFFTTAMSSGGGGGGGGGAISMNFGSSDGSTGHPWTDWFHDQGSLLFAIGEMMGFGTDYVLNVTGWKWLAGGFSTHEGTAGDDLLDFTVTTYEEAPLVLLSTHDQLLFGYEGNDELRGNDGVDRLVGGPGDDLLKGGSDSDYYIYASGDGLDRIIETSGADDTIYFSSELNSADLQVTRVSGTNDLLLYFDNPAQGIILTNQWSSSGAAIEHLHFVGENGLDAGDIASLYLATLTTTGADTIVGSWADERINGLDGDDSLSGLDGDDVIDGGNGNDSLIGGNGNDHLTGGAGNDTITGSYGHDTITGGTGNDSLQGGADIDTYIYNLGDGDDVIYDTSFDSSPDETLIFGSGITPDMIILSRVTGDWDDIKISFAGAGGSIILNEQQQNSGVEKFVFADGTIWTQAEIYARYVAAQQTAGDDVITGTEGADVVEAGAGNDTITTGDGNDTLIGGAGNDNLQGGANVDTYVYNLGDGNDIIFDDSFDSSPDETLIFGEGITPEMIVFSRVSTDWDDMKISFVGSAGSIILNEQQQNSGVEKFVFADGTVWDEAEIYARYIAAQQTSGADTIFGTERGDVINAGAGNDTVTSGDGDDTLTGGTGNDRLEGGANVDTYIYNIGDGDDVIYDASFDSSPDETLIFGEGITAADLIFTRSTTDPDDLIITFQGFAGSIVLDEQYRNFGIEILQFSDGTFLQESDFLI